MLERNDKRRQWRNEARGYFERWRFEGLGWSRLSKDKEENVRLSIDGMAVMERVEKTWVLLVEDVC